MEVVTNYFLLLFFRGPPAIASITPATDAPRGGGVSPETLFNALEYFFHVGCPPRKVFEFSLFCFLMYIFPSRISVFPFLSLCGRFLIGYPIYEPL